MTTIYTIDNQGIYAGAVEVTDPLASVPMGSASSVVGVSLVSLYIETNYCSSRCLECTPVRSNFRK